MTGPGGHPDTCHQPYNSRFVIPCLLIKSLYQSKPDEYMVGSLKDKSST